MSQLYGQPTMGSRILYKITSFVIFITLMLTGCGDGDGRSNVYILRAGQPCPDPSKVPRNTLCCENPHGDCFKPTYDEMLERWIWGPADTVHP